MIRAVVLEAPGRFAVHVVDAPVPRQGEALVRVAWAGICGSDVDLFEGSRPEPFARYPIVPGHEWSGVVEGVGPGVDASLLGRTVVGENIRSCAVCLPCGRGDSPGCETGYAETGFTIDGAWADVLVVPAELLHPLSAGADLRSAAGIEPAACAAAAMGKARLTPGQQVAVVGGGTIGLLCTQLLRPLGVETTVIEPVDAKADIARACGAARCVSPAEAAASLAGRFDVVIEAAGADGTATLAVDVAARGGDVVLCGLPSAIDTIPTLAVVSKGIRLASVFGADRRSWRTVVAAFEAGDLDPGLLVTHELGLDEAPRALQLVAGREPGVGKILLKP